MRMLEIIARADGAAKLSKIAAEAGIRASTAHNILATLSALGYIQRPAAGSDYRLGSRILNLARIAADDDDLRRQFRPLVHDAAERFGESTYLIVPSGDELYYLDGIEKANNPTAHSRLGQRESLSGSAIGLVLAAFMPGVARSLEATQGDEALLALDMVRRRGFAIEQGDYQSGLHCVAVPLRRDGETVAGLCLNGAASRLPQTKLEGIAVAIADMARKSSSG